MTWLDEYTQLGEDLSLDDGRAGAGALLDALGIPEADRDGVVRVEIVKTGGGDVLRLFVRSDYLRSRGLEG